MIKDFFSTVPSDDRLIEQRRTFMKMGLLGVLGAVAPLSFSRMSHARPNDGAWTISFRHAHTKESFAGVYRVGDRYLPEAFERMNYVMRDFRTEEVFPMDPHLIDIISIVQRKADTKVPVDILSAYRSPKTNAMLSRNTRGVASNSFHMYGQAADIRIEDCSTRNLRNIAKSLDAGGVGYYPRSSFVHVDTGTVRAWTS